MTNKIKVLFVTPSLGVGGAERQTLHVANGIDRDEFSTAVFSIRQGGEYEQHLQTDVGLHYSDVQLSSSSLGTIGSHNSLRRVIGSFRPNIVVSFLNHISILCWLAARGMRDLRRCICIQNNVLEESRHSLGRLMQPIYLRLFQAAASRAAGIVFISKGVERGFRSHFKSDAPTKVIYNAGALPNESTASQNTLTEITSSDLNAELPTIVSCGRLHEQKDYPTLLRAFRKVLDQRPARLLVLGEGAERSRLTSLIDELGLQDAVQLLGFQSNPAQYFRQATVFVLSSIYEGFGNVIVEAMSQGTPVISTRCPFGPEEIINDGVNGVLVPVADAEQLSVAILKLINDPILRKQLATAGLQRSADFSLEQITTQYASFFRSMVVDR